MSLRSAIALRDQERHRDGFNQPTMNAHTARHHGDVRVPMPNAMMSQPDQTHYRTHPLDMKRESMYPNGKRDANMASTFFRHHMEKKRNMIPGNY
jgi:hypothetical protein